MAAVLTPTSPGAAPAYDVVFSHLSVRLIKTLVNSAPDAPPLHHIHGPMQLVAVTPDAPMLPTLILSLPGFTLPFRTFNPGTVGGSGIHDAEPPRPTYASFGAGEHGLEGPSIWFKEHVTEEGAWARKSLGQPAAIWTLYLVGAPSPLATHLQDVLAGWPREMPPALPRWLTDPAMYGWPWKDQFIQMPLPIALAQPVPVAVSAPRPLPTPPMDNSTSAARSVPNARPSIPIKPSKLRSTTVAAQMEPPLTPPVEETQTLQNVVSETETVSESASAEPEPKKKTSSPPIPPKILRQSVQSSGRGIPRSVDAPLVPSRPIELLPSLPHSTILPSAQYNVEHNAWAEESQAVPAAEEKRDLASPARDVEPEPASFPDPYRHSLVAVDNETGEVLGILASNIILSTEQEDEADTTVTKTKDDDVEDDAATPHASRFVESKALPPAKVEPEPLRAFTAYRDPDIYSPYAPSTDPDKAARPPSTLGVHTFAPPPLPDKADDEAGWAGTGARDSMASAAFFSAAEELDSGTDGSEGHAGTDAGAPGFKLGSDPVLKEVEGYREGLLVDEVAEEDEGAETDRSGRTVGGLLKRAFKKKNKKGSKKDEKVKEEVAVEELKEQATEQADKGLAAELSQQPAEEVTQSHPLSANASQSPTALTSSGSMTLEAQEIEASNTLPVLRPKTDPNRLANHLPRALLRTSALIDVEHQVWADALAQNEIPASAPYTHLAAKATAADEDWTGGSRDEVAVTKAGGSNSPVDPDEAVNASSSRAAVVAAAAGEYIQGGTVLLKFLQGTITASMVNPAQLARYMGGGPTEHAEEPASRTPDAQARPAAAEEPEDLRTGAMAYIPVLPVHLLYYMGIVTEKPAASESSLPSAAKGALDSVARAAGVGFGVGRLWNTFIESAVGQSSSNATTALSSMTPANVSLDMLGMSRSGVATCWNWVSSAASGALQSVGTAVSTATSAPLVRSSSRDLAVARNGNPHLDYDDDDDWEVTIPDFDPNSLGSTPRPIYRRKAKSILPSSTTGFGLADQQRPAKNSNGNNINGNSIDWKRVSIVHFDAKGVGRRAVMGGDGFGVL
ncbi:unnamed protein product [Tilletia controversa]|uniref:Uncharacterized protein n=1 Tax=Tilletia controversa TaxID=13291 RepID=A0A8X7T065_9BASI|nr:hypothetical protein CF328_g761 [Tilletia controversa]KAE8254316.1 hypothetical protein A4X06_0g955 [Tilletia controversa]CAD6909480.1 unnamed protein product [Tilletia controversa]CAD6951525.1 unnamed protein product [Tilletia controversa]CAD6956781.1 unnamed protein product [Tilletia controversa]